MLKNQTHRLRAIEPGDVASLLIWENDASTWWLGASIAPYSEAVMIKFAFGDHDLYRDKQLRFMLDTKVNSDKGETWEVVGAVDLYEFDPRNLRAGVGIVIDESKRKKGHALEGLNLLSEYAFNHLGVHQLYAEVPSAHKPSLKLFEKAGYLTGELRKDWVRKGSLWLDVNLMQKFSES